MDTSVPSVTLAMVPISDGHPRNVTRLWHVEHANGCVLVRPDDALIFALGQNLLDREPVLF